MFLIMSCFSHYEIFSQSVIEVIHIKMPFKALLQTLLKEKFYVKKDFFFFNLLRTIKNQILWSGTILNQY